MQISSDENPHFSWRYYKRPLYLGNWLFHPYFGGVMVAPILNPYLSHRIHVWYIYTYIWLIFFVNACRHVDKYHQFHGSYGLWLGDFRTTPSSRPAGVPRLEKYPVVSGEVLPEAPPLMDGWMDGWMDESSWMSRWKLGSMVRIKGCNLLVNGRY